MMFFLKLGDIKLMLAEPAEIEPMGIGSEMSFSKTWKLEGVGGLLSVGN